MQKPQFVGLNIYDKKNYPLSSKLQKDHEIQTSTGELGGSRDSSFIVRPS